MENSNYCFSDNLFSIDIFFSSLSHFLIMLISLEYMALGLYMGIFCLLGVPYYFMGSIYLIFVVCEGALGLSVLLLLSQAYGADYLNVASLIF